MSNMVINTNVLALNSHRSMKNVGAAIARSSERLSSGLRINRAADDAAGLAVSEKMRAQIRGLAQASTNAADGVSLVQTAEGALQEVQDMLHRMRVLTLQAGNDTLTEADRYLMQIEVSQLIEEINQTSIRTEFNTLTLINGTLQDAHFQIGPGLGHSMTVSISNMDATALGVATVNIHVPDGVLAANQLAALDTAINDISAQRAHLGAIQNRLEHTIRNLDVSHENLSASESRIRDADMAREMMRLTQKNVLGQAAISMLAQANQQPQQLLQLLR